MLPSIRALFLIPQLRQKLILLGSAGVGKSALAQVFHSDGTQYPKNYSMTVHPEITVKIVNIPDTNACVELFIHDIPGHENFSEYVPKHCEEANSFMLVYDVSNAESFQALTTWLQVAKKSKIGKGTHGVVVANKCDLPPGRRQVSTHQGEEFAKANKLTYFETSAANNTEVDAPFYYLSNWFHGHLESTLKFFTKIAESSTM
ncbi:Intraflagellar transport protein 27 [Irineochytrium annulatum]|nr:Intraflagellar transport protein 27 [Irineochytrium annulatum]